VARAGSDWLEKAEQTPGFAITLLRVAQDAGARFPMSVRQAAAITFKNFVKRNWNDDAASVSVSAEDRATIKSVLVTLMSGMPRLVQAQVCGGTPHRGS
jgi:exportin-2 (importin alpha re-exporter)